MNDPISSAIATLESTFSDSVRQNFGEFERVALYRAMARCRMHSIPDAIGDIDRASGCCVCEICEMPYYDHPMDWRVVGYGDVPFLNILCSGFRVKL